MDSISNNKIVPNAINNNINTVNNAYQTNTNFKDILDNTIKLQFSKHANLRLNTREISLSTDQIKRVEKGIRDANEKGIKDSLVIVDNVNLVVNIKSGIVVTAMNKENRNIFTNIDGAVIV